MHRVTAMFSDCQQVYKTFSCPTLSSQCVGYIFCIVHCVCQQPSLMSSHSGYALLESSKLGLAFLLLLSTILILFVEEIITLRS